MKKDDLNSLEKLLAEREPKSDIYDKLNYWKELYYNELLDYKYIHTIEELQVLKLGGVIKIISLRDEKLKKGGILLNLTTDFKGKWYALIGIKEQKKYRKIYFDLNYFFYRDPYGTYKCDSKTQKMKDYLNKFVTQDEVLTITKSSKSNNIINNLFDEYKNRDKDYWKIKK
jgi:hypothetical protein